MAEMIYVKILAEDTRHNYSEKSPAISIRRPDRIPPSEPTLHKVLFIPDGTQLGWRFSSSDDVSHHELQRKPSHTGEWIVILTIPKNEEHLYEVNITQGSIVPTCYLDSLNLKQQDYNYRLVAFDEYKNFAGSEVSTVRPYDDKVKGDVGEFSLIQKEEIIGLETLKKVELSWSCNYECTLYAFTIYRSANGSPLCMYKTIRVSDLLSQYTQEELNNLEGGILPFTCDDEDVIDGARYIYQLVGRFQDGASTEVSDVKTIKIQ